LTTESAQFLHVGGAPGEDAVMGAGNSNPLKEQDAVSVAMLGSIATGGDWAMGLLAQAIGGGGGSGYVGALTDGQSTPAEGGVSVGGGAGSYGYGGDIAVRVDGGAETGIATSGVGAYGILAQSIGAGGGLGVALASGTGVALNVGGRQSADTSHVQDGGKVRLYGSKTILTEGADAHGVVLQSVGGGGGVGGITLPASGGSEAGDIVLGGTDYGNGQTVTVD